MEFNNEDVIQGMLRSIERHLNEESDKVIEEKVNDFRQKLIREKNKLIAEMIDFIEIETSKNMYSNAVEFNIYIRPKTIRK